MKGRKPNLIPLDGGLRHVPKPPAWMFPEAVAEWNRVAPDLVARRVLGPHELGLLEQYVTQFALFRRAADAIARDGEYADGKRHPAFSTIAQASGEARRMAAELGLTPTSRNRLPAPKEDDDGAADLAL